MPVLYFRRVVLISKRFAASFILFAIAASAQTPKSVDVVLSDYAKALGGLPAIEAVTTRHIRATTSLLGKQELYWQSPDKVLLLADKERTGYDGHYGWFYSKRKKLTRLPQAGQVPLQIHADPLRYVRLRKLYSEINPAAQQTVDGTLMDVLVAPNNLGQTTFYFDAKTHLLARIAEKGDTSAYFTKTIWLENYKPVDGVLFPYLITQMSDYKGSSKEEFRVKSIEQNLELAAEMFSKPQTTKLVLGGKR